MPEAVMVYEPGDRFATISRDGVVRRWTVEDNGSLIVRDRSDGPPPEITGSSPEAVTVAELIALLTALPPEQQTYRVFVGDCCPRALMEIRPYDSFRTVFLEG